MKETKKVEKKVTKKKTVKKTKPAVKKTEELSFDEKCQKVEKLIRDLGLKAVMTLHCKNEMSCQSIETCRPEAIGIMEMHKDKILKGPLGGIFG